MESGQDDAADVARVLSLNLKETGLGRSAPETITIYLDLSQSHLPGLPCYLLSLFIHGLFRGFVWQCSHCGKLLGAALGQSACLQYRTNPFEGATVVLRRAGS